MASPARAGAAAGDDVASADPLQAPHHLNLRSTVRMGTQEIRSTVASSDSRAPLTFLVPQSPRPLPMASPAGAVISVATGDDVASVYLQQALRHLTLRSSPEFRSPVASGNSAASLSPRPLPMASPVRADTSGSDGDDFTSADLQVLQRLTLCSPTPASRSISRDSAASSTFADLPEPLLLEILGRLPNCSSLFSAAFVNRWWRAVLLSSANRAFVLEFFASRPAPLLGFFFEVGSPERMFFHPIAPFDPIVRDALARGNFFLHHIAPPLEGDDAVDWEVMDCQRGYLLLSWPASGDLVVYNPLSGYQWRIESPQFVHHLGTYHLNLAVSPEGPLSVLCVYHTNGSTTELSVFRFGGRWRLFGRYETADPWSSTCRRAVQSGSILFWPYPDRDQMFALDMVDEEVAWLDIPPQSMDFIAALTADRNLSLLSTVGSFLCVWKQKLECVQSQEKEWELESYPLGSKFLQTFGVPLETHTDLRLISVHHGLVYLCSVQIMASPDSPWVIFSFCLRTGEIQMVVQTDRFRERAYPYHYMMTALQNA